MSFMSTFGGGGTQTRDSRSSSQPLFPSSSDLAASKVSVVPPHVPVSQAELQSASAPQHTASPAKDTPSPVVRTRTERSSSRPASMIQTYQPPLMDVAPSTIPELQPIFAFLNSHSNKLYQEGYFLKLNDLDICMWKLWDMRGYDRY